MATVTLPFSDGRFQVRLPRYCIVCGDPDCSFKNVSFSSRFIKPTIGPFGQEYRRTLAMTVPLCEEHRGHFTGQFLRALGIMGAVFVLFMSVGLAAFTFVGYRMFGPTAFWALGIGGLLAVLAIVLIVLLMRGAGSCVTCQNITERSITLINVHKKFARAVELGEEGEEAPDERPRKRRDEEDDRPRKPRRPDEPLRSPNRVGIWIIVGVGVLGVLLACGGVITVFQWWIARSMGGKPNPGPEPVPVVVKPPEVRPNPLPIDPAWRDEMMQARFLADLPEYDVTVGWGNLGKNGVHGFGIPGVAAEQNRVLFRGDPSLRALAMVPLANGSARVKYRLDGHKLLRGWAVMADLHPNNPDRQAASPFTCSVLGDGRLLWQSKPLQKPGDGESFRLSVQGVKELELRVTASGSFHSAWAAWLDPYLLK